MVYQAHVNSVLTYCNVIWANTFPTYTETITKLLKRIVRNITHSDFYAHTRPLFKQLQLLDFDGVRKFSLAQYMYKNRNNLLPPLLPNHDHRTRNKHLYRLPPCRTALYDRSFINEGPRLWNSLMIHCPNVTDAQSLFSFKRKLKRYLLQL